MTQEHVDSGQPVSEPSNGFARFERWVKIIGALLGIVVAILGIVTFWNNTTVKKQGRQIQSGGMDLNYLIPRIGSLSEAVEKLQAEVRLLSEKRTENAGKTASPRAIPNETDLELRERVEVRILDPAPEGKVGPSPDVTGECDAYDKPLWAFVIVHGESPPADRKWTVTDIVQVQRNCKWSGLAQLERAGVRVTQWARIQAIVSEDVQAYNPFQTLFHPPSKGVSSHPIRVKRIK